MQLKNKSAVITGGSSGIGAATAELFAREGAKVVIADVSDKAQTVVNDILEQGGEAVFVYTDVSDEESVQHVIKETEKRFNQVDILVANAGIGQEGSAHEVSLSDWKKMLDINLTGVFLSNKYAIQSMLKQKGGSIINMASILGHVGQAGITSYTAAKGGVVNLTRSEAVTYAPLGIRVNAVCPGYIETPLLEQSSDKVKENLVSLHPIGRLGKPEEVAEACLFLASDRASFITGANLLVDGGYTAQ